MKEDENIFEKAVKSLKNRQVPPGPSDELAQATIEKLNNISEQPDTIEFNRQLRFANRITMLNSFVKFAAAAVFLIIAGFAAGRLTTTKPPDIEDIRASLEPAIHNPLLGEVKQYMQLSLANSNVKLKDDLTEQYRQDLIQLSANIVTANSNLTNQLLQNLIESVDEAQKRQQQLFEAALEQVDLNRQRDNARFSNALFSFATQTENELNQTKQDMAELFKYTQSDGSVPNEFNNPNNIN